MTLMRSPPTATIRLMKFVSERCRVPRGHLLGGGRVAACRLLGGLCVGLLVPGRHRLGFAAFVLRLGLRLGPVGLALGQLLLTRPKCLLVLGHYARFGLALLRAGLVAALTHTSAATDPLAQVVELRPAYVAVGDHLDLLDLR